jgi:hypothetical protein
MTYFEDLTPHTYTKHAEEVGVVNIGWLEKGHRFPTGPTSKEFQAALQELCEKPIHLHRGFHVCEFCAWKSRDDWSPIGNGQIRIRDENGLWYVAPTMIYHYVDNHNYQPPDEFIMAVLNPIEIAEDVPE